MTTTVLTLEDALVDLPPIGLDELVGRAALQTRVDRKYVVPLAVLPRLLDATPRDTQVLDIDGSRLFGYRSTYLDTPHFDSFHLAGRNRRRRWKVRTRSYLDTGTSWLEVKTRGRRGVTVKARIPHEDALVAPLSERGRLFVDQELAECSAPTRATELRPVLATAYRRATLFLPDCGSRVTVDVDLGWSSLGRRPADLDVRRVAVVESKCGSTPSAFDRLLWCAGHRPVRMSKYGVGMAALHPELPRLKWHRVMTHSLDLTPWSTR